MPTLMDELRKAYADENVNGTLRGCLDRLTSYLGGKVQAQVQVVEPHGGDDAQNGLLLRFCEELDAPPSSMLRKALQVALRRFRIQPSEGPGGRLWQLNAGTLDIYVPSTASWVDAVEPRVRLAEFASVGLYSSLAPDRQRQYKTLDRVFVTGATTPDAEFATLARDVLDEQTVSRGKLPDKRRRYVRELLEQLLQ